MVEGQTDFRREALEREFGKETAEAIIRGEPVVTPTVTIGGRQFFIGAPSPALETVRLEKPGISLPEAGPLERPLDVELARAEKLPEAPEVRPTVADISQETIVGLEPPPPPPPEMPVTLEPERTIAEQEERARQLRAAVPVGPEEFIAGRIQPKVVEERFGIAAPVVLFGQQIAPTAVGFLSPLIGEKQIPIEQLGEEIRKIGFGVTEDPFGALGRVSTVAAVTGAGIMVGRKVSPRTRIFRPEVFERAELAETIVTWRRVPKFLVLEAEQRVFPTTAIFPFDEFVSMIKKGEIKGFFETVPRKIKRPAVVELPVIRGERIERIFGEALGERRVFVERFAPGLVTEPEKEIGLLFKAKDLKKIKPFALPEPVKPVSPGARARAKLLMEGKPRMKPPSVRLKEAKDLSLRIRMAALEGVPIEEVTRAPAFARLPGDILEAQADLVADLSKDLKDITGRVDLTVTDIGLKEVTKKELKEMELRKPKEVEIIGLAETAKLTTRISQQQKTAQKQLERQAAKTLQLERPITRPPAPRVGVPMPVPVIPILPSFPPAKKVAKKPTRKPGYHAFVKERGKVRRLTRKPRTKRTALSIGAEHVDQLPAASFTVKPADKVASGPEIDTYRNIAFKFRERRTKRALLIVEKRRFRIDSPGERRGIAGKGIDVRKAI